MKGPLSLKERMDDFWVYPKLSKVNDKREYRDDFFQFLQQPSLDSKAALNLYIHIPFCDSACIFCPYYKVHGSKNLEIKISEYIDTLIAEMKHYASTPYFYGKRLIPFILVGATRCLCNLQILNGSFWLLKHIFRWILRKIGQLKDRSIV